MFFSLGRGSDLDNSLVECAWDMADRSTGNFAYYEAMEWRSGEQAQVIPVMMKLYYLRSRLSERGVT